MIMCLNCGSFFPDDDMGHAKDTTGESLCVCPDCGSPDLTEADQCAICGEPYDVGDLIYGTVCDGCFRKHRTIREFCEWSDTFLDRSEPTPLDDLVLTQILRLSYRPGYVFCESETHEMLRKIFDECAATKYGAIILEGYITDHLTGEWRSEYAEWLGEKAAKGEI